MEAELGDPGRQLRSLTTHFLAIPPEGTCEVAVEVQRSGRHVSYLSARLLDGDRVLALAVAAFATPFEVTDAYSDTGLPLGLAPPPDPMPPPPEREGLPRMSYNFRMVPVVGPAPFSGDTEHAVESGGWLELVESHPLDAALVVVLTDAWFPAPFVRLTGPAPAPTVDLTVHIRAPLPLPPGPTLTAFRSSLLRDGFFEEDGTVHLPDGTLVAQSRQLALLLT